MKHGTLARGRIYISIQQTNFRREAIPQKEENIIKSRTHIYLIVDRKTFQIHIQRDIKLF